MNGKTSTSYHLMNTRFFLFFLTRFFSGNNKILTFVKKKKILTFFGGEHTMEYTDAVL